MKHPCSTNRTDTKVHEIANTGLNWLYSNTIAWHIDKKLLIARNSFFTGVSIYYIMDQPRA